MPVSAVDLMPHPFDQRHPDLAGYWRTWSPREALAPEFAICPEGLVIEATGRVGCCGCWERPLPPLEGSGTYRVRVQFRTEGVPHPGANVWGLLVRASGDSRALVRDSVMRKIGDEEGWSVLEAEVDGREGKDVRLCLYLAWTERGRVVWRGARVEAIRPEAPRVVRVAAAAGHPPSAGTAEKIAYLERLVDRAAGFGAQLVCLPEMLNQVRGLPTRAALAYTSFLDALADKAKQHRMHICAGLLQDVDDLIYNTAVFLDEGGRVFGVYRKTHPTVVESLVSGISPGDGYPVFDSPLGRLGALVCYDYHHPEVCRILSLQGAQIICLPNAGDGRESGRFWETVVRTRAIDNQVHIVAAVNSGRALIVSPSGDILGSTGKNLPGVAVADIDLGETMVNYAGHRIRGVYDKVRRAETFGALTRHIWDP